MTPEKKRSCYSNCMLEFFSFDNYNLHRTTSDLMSEGRARKLNDTDNSKDIISYVLRVISVVELPCSSLINY